MTLAVRILAAPVRRLGFEQWSALVLEADTDRVLWSVVRWSEAQARTDASRYASKQQWSQP
jgi:hypothetical protein